MTIPNTPLAHKAIVITGAGRGVGEAVAKAAAGASVIVNDIDPEPAQACAAAIVAAGGRALAHPADVGDWAQAEGLIERRQDEYGAIVCLLNRHRRADALLGPGGAPGPPGAHLISTLACSALKAMRARGSGAIVNTTSGASMGSDWQSAYAAAKGGPSPIRRRSRRPARCADQRHVALRRHADDGQLQRLPGGAQPAEHAAAAAGGRLRRGLCLAAVGLRGGGERHGVRPDGELYVSGCAAALEPTVTRPDWSFAAMAQAGESGALAPAQPLGFNRIRAEPGAVRAGYTGKPQPEPDPPQ